MNKFVINLDRSTDRLQHYDNSYQRWKGVDGKELSDDDPIINKMFSPYNLKNKNQHLGKCGCLLSHKNLWEHIINNKLNNVLIVEDDAEQISELPDINDLPKDGITYFGGFFHSINVRNTIIGDIQSNDKVNKVKSNFRILTTLSYYIPSYDICEKLYSELKKWEKKRFRAIDIMLSKFNMDKYYYYPAIYIERNVPSLINEEKKHRCDKFYKFKIQK
jgi:GR25 family glycosyltransferase involved in LPS biosynthesis